MVVVVVVVPSEAVVVVTMVTVVVPVPAPPLELEDVLGGTQKLDQAGSKMPAPATTMSICGKSSLAFAISALRSGQLVTSVRWK